MTSIALFPFQVIYALIIKWLSTFPKKSLRQNFLFPQEAFYISKVISKIYSLHTDNSQYVRNRAQQDNNQTNRCKVFNEYSVQFLSSEWRRLFNFFRDSVNSNHFEHQNTGCKCCQRHHYWVCHKIKEIKEVHSEDTDEIQKVLNADKKVALNASEKKKYDNAIKTLKRILCK